MSNNAAREKINRYYLEHSKSQLGLLSVGLICLYPSIRRNYISEWQKAKIVADRLETNPFEILILDTPTRILPSKRKELIADPGLLFGKNYDEFLEFEGLITWHYGEVLRVSPDIFTPELLADMRISSDADGSRRQIIEANAVTFLRNRLPYVKDKRYDPKSATNKYYNKVAEKTKDGILAIFEKLVNNIFPEQDEQYRKNIALLGGLAALEILFVDKPNHSFLPLLTGGR